MGALNGLIELFKVTNYAYVFPVPLHHRKGLTGPLTGLYAAFLQDPGIKAVFKLPGVSLLEVKGCIVGATAMRGGNF